MINHPASLDGTNTIYAHEFYQISSTGISTLDNTYAKIGEGGAGGGGYTTTEVDALITVVQTDITAVKDDLRDNCLNHTNLALNYYNKTEVGAEVTTLEGSIQSVSDTLTNDYLSTTQLPLQYYDKTTSDGRYYTKTEVDTDI